MCPLHILYVNLQSSNSFFSYHNSHIQTWSRNFRYESFIEYPSIYFYQNIFYVTILFYPHYLHNFLSFYYHNRVGNKLLQGVIYLHVFVSSVPDEDVKLEPGPLHFRWNSPWYPLHIKLRGPPEPVSKVRKKESRTCDKIRNLISGCRARGVVTILTELSRLQPNN